MHIPALPTTSLPQFLHFQPVTLNGVSAKHLGGDPIDLGIALLFSPPHTADAPLLRISPSLILSQANIEAASKSDRHLRDALAAAGSLAYTPRGACIIFLLLRMSTAAGLLAGGERDAWCEYIQFLPRSIPLPTTWTAAERALLTGTSLEAAVSAKLKALTTEFESFKAATSEFPWAKAAWWDNDSLTLEDWIHADCQFRSRSLEVPGHGVAMVPVLDFANHSDMANAYFAVGKDEAVELRLRPGAQINERDEVTIDYSGEEKSAAEFVFSYGFLPDTMGSAGSLRLPVPCAEDDPLVRAKHTVWPRDRAVRVFEEGEEVHWSSDWVYLSVANEEDGLTFQVLQTNEGGRWLRVSFGDEDEELDLLANPQKLKELLRAGKMWEVFELRAVATVKGVVEDTLQRLLKGRDAMEEEAAEGEELELRPQPDIVGKKLRDLEETLLLRAVETLETQMETLVQHPTVQSYLSAVQEQQSSEDQQAESVEGEDGEIDLS
ncbi:hypothetical protein FN846DRAFT_84883 [Sphaerosporella brunnea]|uniref:Uncharacterized protein n=1 Tax=Sphaerosporella brunnea TaxID=1250544 RepID=A0A5J5ETE8_9PEZI|nr:hypothetical protein FN846DRAFT_84883 [Sphaerosporella brunnea]